MENRSGYWLIKVKMFIVIAIYFYIMVYFFSDALALAAIGEATFFLKNIGLKFWLLGIFCASIPDADMISFLFGIAYESFGGREDLLIHFSLLHYQYWK